MANAVVIAISLVPDILQATPILGAKIRQLGLTNDFDLYRCITYTLFYAAVVHAAREEADGEDKFEENWMELGLEFSEMLDRTFKQ